MKVPLYAFRCPKCGHKFEELTSVSGREDIVCPQCGEKAERVYEGRCAFGAKAGGGRSCSGQCQGCQGCGHGND